MVYVALLCGINVGGKRRLAMSDLRAMLSDLGFARPWSLLQSGILIFEADSDSPDQLVNVLERETKKRFALEVDYIVRTASELARAIACNPFPVQAASDPAHLVVTFLRNAPDPSAVRALEAAMTGPERAVVLDDAAYIVYSAGIADSRVTIAVVERLLDTRGTGRNWSTLAKLSAAAGA